MYNTLGKVYADQECVFREGDRGTCMYVIQRGTMEVVQSRDGREVRLAILKAGDVFGEMALFQKEQRSATVRALGEAQALTVDKRTLLRQIQEDPLVALNLMEVLCQRIRTLSHEHSTLAISVFHQNDVTPSSGGESTL